MSGSEILRIIEIAAGGITAFLGGFTGIIAIKYHREIKLAEKRRFYEKIAKMQAASQEAKKYSEDNNEALATR